MIDIYISNSVELNLVSKTDILYFKLVKKQQDLYVETWIILVTLFFSVDIDFLWIKPHDATSEIIWNALLVDNKEFKRELK